MHRDLYIIRDPLKYNMLKYLDDLNITILLVSLGVIDEFTMNKPQLREYLVSACWAKQNCRNFGLCLTHKGYWKMFNKKIFPNIIQ